jgi:hypothetical protein
MNTNIDYRVHVFDYTTKLLPKQVPNSNEISDYYNT